MHVEVGTLSKAFGVVGGLVAGASVIVEWLRQRGRPFLFSSAMTVPDVAACIEAVNILSESHGTGRPSVGQRGNAQAGACRGWALTSGTAQTPIVPVMLGEAPLAQEFSRRLFEAGVFATAIGYPTVPLGKARIRVMNSAAHSRDDLEEALDIFAGVGRDLGVIG